MGFNWGDKEYYTSDYFETLYGYAVKLIEKGLAYVDHQTPEQIAEHPDSYTGHYLKRLLSVQHEQAS